MGWGICSILLVLCQQEEFEIGLVHLVYSSKRPNSKFPPPHLVSDVVEGAEHVRGGAEELHAAALLVLELGRDGGPVRYQPDAEIMFLTSISRISIKCVVVLHFDYR